MASEEYNLRVYTGNELKDDSLLEGLKQKTQYLTKILLSEKKIPVYFSPYLDLNLEEVSNSYVLVVTKQSNLVGFLTSIYKQKDQVLEITGISAVRAGHLLIDKIKQIARERRARNVTLVYSVESLGFYEKMGFKVDSKNKRYVQFLIEEERKQNK